MSTTAVADSIQNDNYKPIKNRKGDDFSNMDKQLAIDMMRKEMLKRLKISNLKKQQNFVMRFKNWKRN
ncbi:MAG: hypothetical protein CM1200mP10_16000 [Candidatus Neomarinimicrobiota bacterium]|nr:MAG: hypothetical protein CM1200mP10_16000 [Candidatus Neomarinimicrobiota bacterium]